MATKQESKTALVKIESLIITLRGERVIVDSDLAKIYGVDTRTLNQAVKRNIEKFPEDFMFQLSSEEFENLKSQNVTSRFQHGGRRKLPFVFTEHGAIMAANVLNSERAAQMSVFVVRAFVKMREILATNKTLAEKLEELEKKLTSRVDLHERVISYILEEIKKLMEPPPMPEPKRRTIGFHREDEETQSKVKLKNKC